METEDEITNFLSATTKTTSWSIINGSLDDTITYESSISPVEDYDSAVCKPSLLLRRPGPDSAPCEITLRFSQRHEIKQVYVRSTARIYELYCAEKAKSDNAYLCTVRCGMAARNEEVLELTRDEDELQASAVVPSASMDTNGSPKNPDEGELKGDGCSSEDSWVDVKVPGGDGSLTNKADACMDKGPQDFYEATAEISDADPCISLTLRLLSIKSGESIYIDEVYVFADPVLSDEPDSPPSRVESSSGSAFMSMILPTILQLSRSRAHHSDKSNDDNIVKMRESQDTGPSLNGSVTDTTNIQTKRIPGIADQPKAAQEPNSTLNYQTCSGFPMQAPEVGHKPDNGSYSRLENILEQLVSRVARMENFCSRFEESMLKPVTSLEMRLERIEKQLALLSKNSGLSTVPSCIRISAPEFSSNESVTNSFHSDVDHCSSFGTSESFKKDKPSDVSLSVNATQLHPSLVTAREFSCNTSESNSFNSDVDHRPRFGTSESSKSDDFASRELSVQPSDVSSNVDATQPHPSLVVTAPEFPYLDDEDEVADDTPEAVEDFSKYNVKKTASIEDALASALAGLLSSTQPLVSSDVCKSMAADSDSVDGRDRIFIVKHDEPTGPSASAEQSSGQTVGEVAVGTSSEDTEHNKPIVPSASAEQSSYKAVAEGAVSNSAEAPVEGDLQDITSPDCTVSSLVEKKQELLSEEASSKVCLGCIIDQHHYELAANETSNASVATKETESREAEFSIGDTCVSDESSEDPVQLHEENISSGSGKEVVMKGADVLQDVLSIPNPFVLNLDFPILDVKFVSPEDSASHSSLKELLTIWPQDAEALCIEERMEAVHVERNQNSLIKTNDCCSEGLSHELTEAPEHVEVQSIDERMWAVTVERNQDSLIKTNDCCSEDVSHQLTEGPEHVEVQSIEERMWAARAEQIQDILTHDDQSFGDVQKPKGETPLDSRAEVVSLI